MATSRHGSDKESLGSLVNTIKQETATNHGFLIGHSTGDIHNYYGNRICYAGSRGKFANT